MTRTRFEVFHSRHPLMRKGYKVECPPISSSSMTTFNTCQRKFMFRYRLGLVPRGANFARPALLIGKYLHSALRDLALGKNPDAVVSRLTAEAAQEIDDIRMAEGGVLPSGVGEKISQCQKKAVAMALVFRRIMLEQGRGILVPSKTEVMFLEEEVKVRPPEDAYRSIFRERVLGKPQLPIQIVGTIDIVTRDKPTGEISVSDYKSCTNSAISRALTATFEPQVGLYRILADSLVGPNERVMYFNHYIIRKPTIRVRQKETFDEYVVRLKQWYLDGMQRTPNDPPIVVSRVRLEGPLYPAGIRAMLRAVNFASHRPCDARNFPCTGAPHACTDLYGNECEYLPLCSSDPVTWTDQIAIGFRQDFRYAE